MNHFEKDKIRKKPWAMLAVFAVFSISCGETQKNEGPDTQTASPSDSETSGPEETDTPSETEKTVPEFPERCVPQTERVGGEAVRQFELTDEGSGVYPSIAVNPETGDALFVFAHIDEDTKIWQIKTRPYKANAADEEADAGLLYTRELKDAVVPSAGDAGSLNPSAVYGHGVFSAVWLDGRFRSDCTPKTIDECDLDVVFLQMDKDGKALGTPAVLSNEDLGVPRGRPAIAVLPDGFLAVWTAAVDREIRLVARRLDTSGAPLDKPLLLETSAVDAATVPCVAAGDEVAVIVYADSSGQRVSSLIWPHEDDDPPDTSILISEASGQNKSAVAAAGADGFLVAWNSTKDGDTQIFSRTLDAKGRTSGDIQQTTWAKRVGSPAVAAHDDTYAVAWTSPSDKGADECVLPKWCSTQIFVTIVDEQGQAAAEPVRLSEDPNDASTVKVAWDGVGWTAAWQTARTYREKLFFGQMTCE